SSREPRHSSAGRLAATRLRLVQRRGRGGAMRSTVRSAADHHSRPRGGRDPNEAHRVATSLELLFDLTFATSFGRAAEQLAEALAHGHSLSALIAFGFASFAICWSWSEFSWFSSAYDTDVWIFRVLTMVQMIGVL